MSKKVLIDAFFNQFSTFLDELRQMYPEDPDFPIFISTLSLMKSANPMLVLTFVKTEIVDPYGDKIRARDESFFLEEDYAKRGDVNLDIVQKLKQYINGMSATSKDTIWKYIDIITKLCIKSLD